MRGLFLGGAILGFVLGLVTGLLVSRSYRPGVLQADLIDLRLEYKDDYLRMIAAEFSIDGDMGRALDRLGRLKLDQPATSVARLAQVEPRPLNQQALVRLALALQEPDVALARPTFTPLPTRTATSLPSPSLSTPSPIATLALITPIQESETPDPAPAVPTLEPNPDAPHYQLKSRSRLNCFQTMGRSHIEVQVQDGAGKPVPGVGVEIHWASGDELFYTGLKPERGVGFADLKVAPGIYSARLAGNAWSQAVENLDIEAEAWDCSPDSPVTSGWSLVFERIEGN